MLLSSKVFVYLLVVVAQQYIVSAGFFSFLKENTYCKFEECCNDKYIPANFNALQSKLKSSLFGQHIVIEHLVPTLETHFHSTIKSRKPLVISFHGTPGVGKTYVTNIIAETLYANGLKSKFVHKYYGRADFIATNNLNEYKEKINKEVREAIVVCPRSLFIFDEVEQMPMGIFEALTSLLDYNEIIDGQDMTQAIFIFMSNTASLQISNHLAELMRKGTLRDDTKMSMFEQILEVGAYNIDGGMKKASLIDAHVIDHYIPFLPLEKAHVYKCLEVEFLRWGKTPQKNEIEKMIKEVITFDRNLGLFATAGCKRLDKKVAVEVAHTEL